MGDPNGFLKHTSRELPIRRPVPLRLERLMDAFVSDFTNDRELAALLGAHTGFFAGTGSERLTAAHQLLTEMFAAGQERGEIRTDVPSSQLAQIFVDLILAMIRSWVDEPADERPLADRLKLALSILLRGCVLDGAGSAGSAGPAQSELSTVR